MLEKRRLTVDIDEKSPPTDEEAKKLGDLRSKLSSGDQVQLVLLRACTDMARELDLARIELQLFDEAKSDPGDDRISIEDLERLDCLNPDCSFADVVNSLLHDAGGDAMLALRRLVRRSLANDNELDTTRLALYDLQVKHGEKPLGIEDPEELRSHLRTMFDREMKEISDRWTIVKLTPDADMN